MKTLKNCLRWVNCSFLLFCLLFAFEPILCSSEVYLSFMILLSVVGFIVLAGGIIGIWSGNIPIRQFLIRSQKSLWTNTSIYVLGLIISYIYHSSLITFGYL